MNSAAAEALITRFRSARRDRELAVLEGFHALKHALRFGADLRAVVTADLAELERLASELGPDVKATIRRQATEVPQELFERLSPGRLESGAISLAMRPVIGPGQIRVLPGLAPIVLLENPTHLGNVGAVIRVAAAAGAEAVITTGQQDPWHPNAIRGSAGLHYALPVWHSDEWDVTGRPVVAIDPEGDPLEPASLPANAIYAFGSERAGLSPALLARAERRVRIPMESDVSSLNLATAVAVILYVWRLQPR